MTTDFYSHGGYPATGAAGTSAGMRSELDLVEAGFAKLAPLTGNGSKFLRVNSGATAHEAIDVPTALAALNGVVISPTQITANQNDYNPTSLSTATVVRLSTDASRNLTGLAGGSTGRVLWVANSGSFNVVLKDDDAGSSAANRFALAGDVTLLPDMMVLLWYDATSSRWRAVGQWASAFIQTLLDDVDAAAARTTLGLGTMALEAKTITTEGDILVGGTAGALARKGIGTDGHELVAATSPIYLPPSARAVPYRNVRAIESHTGNAVTYTLKGEDGNDLSATNPGFIFFPSATLTSGAFDIVKLTSNISVTVSSGSTLGHASGIAQHTFIYALKTGSTAEIFVSNLPPDYPGVFHGVRLVSTTAEGGAGAADSATGLYSTTARSNVAWVPLAKVRGTQTTAGTWAADPTQIDMAPFALPTCAFRANRSAGQTIGHATNTKVQLNNEDYDPDGSFDAATNYRWQPNVAGLYRFACGTVFVTTLDGASAHALAYKSGSPYSAGYNRMDNASGQGVQHATEVLLNGTTDYVEFYAYQDTGGNSDAQGDATRTFAVGSRIGGGKS